MIHALYPRFTRWALNVHGGPHVRSTPPARRDTHLRPHTPDRRLHHLHHLRPRSRTARRRACVSRCVNRRSMNPAKRRRGYPTLRECGEILGKCAHRNAVACSLARNSQIFRPPTHRERHGRTADGRTDTPSNSRQGNPGQNQPETRPAALESRRDLWTQNHPADPARRRRRARPTQTRGSALRRPKRPRARWCAFVFSRPSTTDVEAMRETPIPRAPSNNAATVWTDKRQGARSCCRRQIVKVKQQHTP